MSVPTNSKRVYSQTDAKPIVLYAKQSASSQDAYPVLVDATGAFVMVQTESSSQVFLDYGTRDDGQPLYQGYAARSVATSTEAWTIYKYTYNASGYMTIRQTAIDVAWDNRATTAVYA